MERLEIEKKALLDKPKEIIDLLKKKYSLRSICKNDYYFKNSINELRVRTDQNSIYITHKMRDQKDNFEKNIESELSINSKLEDVLNFLKRIGYKEFFKKEKKGYLCFYSGLAIEVVQINKGPWYLEVEYIGNDRSKAEEEINKIFQDCQINTFDSRNYYQILKDLKIKS